MIYVLLDTNIIIDMVVDRRNQIDGNLLDNFIRLLNFNEVKLILPAIVKTETFRHLDEEVDRVGKKIDDSMKSIEELYGIAAYHVDPLDLTEYKKNSKAELLKAQNLFNQNKEQYKQNIRDVIELVFSHANTILIDDECLMAKVEKRRVHKRAPFHKEQKESYGDGTIVETLVNIKQFVNIEADDIIYFVTGNYLDFSKSKEEKRILHPDISFDIKNSELNVKYFVSFGELVLHELKNNLQNATFTEEYLKELEEQEETERIAFEFEELDRNRASGGLTGLLEFEDKVEEELPDSPFGVSVQDAFDRINKCLVEIEEIKDIFDEEIGIDSLQCKNAVEAFQDICLDDSNPTVSNIIKICDWIRDQREALELYDGSLPDYISYGEEYLFSGSNNQKYCLVIGSLEYLSPSDGGSDVIDVYLQCDKEVIASGTIDISYGYLEVDNATGEVGNGCEESIDYNTENIETKLLEICNSLESFVAEKKRILSILKENLEEECDLQ